MTRKEKHYEAIKIIEAIELFELRLNSVKVSLNGYGGQNYGWLKVKYEHQIIIFKMCINRLEQRYSKLITKLK